MVCAYKKSYSTRAHHIVHVCHCHTAGHSDHSIEYLMSAAGYDSQSFITNDIYLNDDVYVLDYIP